MKLNKQNYFKYIDFKCYFYINFDFKYYLHIIIKLIEMINHIITTKCLSSPNKCQKIYFHIILTIYRTYLHTFIYYS